ncbi:MAG: ABC transporter ATP-binding protein [Eubacterium sp.]|nr:ABC transporter ATP-binding protein [Eubacterium sp.]
MSALLECRKLTKRYKAKEVLKQVDLTLESGRIIGLLGPNGSGKTTLIKLINGLLTPTGGELFFCGGKIGEQSKQHISYLPDQTYLNMNLRVRDVIAFFQDFYEDFEKDRACDMLKKLNISADDRLKTLSKGTKEKVQLVLVMSRRAKLYVLDEPIAGVDPAVRDYILNTIISNYEPEASVLIATHLIADIENILDEVILIQNGQVMQHLPVDDIRSKEGKSVDAYFREVFKC